MICRSLARTRRSRSLQPKSITSLSICLPKLTSMEILRIPCINIFKTNNPDSLLSKNLKLTLFFLIYSIGFQFVLSPLLSKIKWNFTKFIIDKNGQPVVREGPPTAPNVSLSSVVVTMRWLLSLVN